MTDLKVLVGIPCYNEATFIADIVGRTKKHAHPVVGVDDGSTDETAVIVEKAGTQVSGLNIDMKGTALITGVTGFVGAHLAVKLLEKGHPVVGLVNENKPVSTLSLLGLTNEITRVQGDICNSELMRQILAKHYVQDVYHLAAQALVGVALKDPLSTYKVSCLGTASVLEACKDVGVRGILCTSSDKVYGDGLNKSENSLLDGRGIYETSKVCMDYIARSFYHAYALPVVVSRACNIYGECDLNRRVIPNTIVSLKRNEAPIIFKNDNSLREYIYVDDVCEAYIMLVDKIEHSKGDVFNIGTGEIIGQEALVKKIIDVSGLDVEASYVEKPPALFEINQQSINSERIQLSFGWKPRFSLSEGLKKTWERWK